jgi:hypothetical protein
MVELSMNYASLYAVIGMTTCLAIAFCYLWLTERKRADAAAMDAASVGQSSERRRRELVALYDVLNGYAGGVAKRFDEHNLLADAILKNAPQLAQPELNVVTLLNVNRAFLAALQNVASIRQD